MLLSRVTSLNASQLNLAQFVAHPQDTYVRSLREGVHVDFLLARTYSKSGAVQDEAFCVRPTLRRLNVFFTEQLAKLERQHGERRRAMSNNDIRAFVSKLTGELRTTLHQLRGIIKNDDVVRVALSCMYKIFRDKLRWDLRARKPTAQSMPSPSECLSSLCLFDFLGPTLSAADTDSSSTSSSQSSGKNNISLSNFLPAMVVHEQRDVAKLKPRPCKFHLINFYGSGCTRENCRFAHDTDEELTKQLCSRVTCRKRFYARHAKGLTRQEWYRAPRFFCYDHLERPSKLYKPGRLVSHTSLTRKKGAKHATKKVTKQKKQKAAASSRKSNSKTKNIYSSLAM